MKKYMSFLFILFMACSQNGETDRMNRIPGDILLSRDDIMPLTLKKIYFGHMSVGYNIIEGLKAAAPSDPGLNILETSDPKDFNKPVFAHSKTGENTKPETKISDFINKIDSGLGNKADIAFFKFCYADVTAETDVKKLFNIYKTEMDKLARRYSHTVFLHVTVPVTTEDESSKRKIKDFIKGIAGRKVTDHSADNIKRMEFNTLLRNEYNTKVFDLAEIESTDINGNIMLSHKGGVAHHLLMKEYTDDGGHLNQTGRNIAAPRLTGFIRKKIY